MTCPTTITPAPIPGINDMRAVTAHGLADAATLLNQWLEEDHPWTRCCPPDLTTYDRALAAIQRAAKLLTERDEVLEQLRRERDELAADYSRLMEKHNALHISAKRSRDERVALTADLAEVSASHAELAARLEAIERAEPVAWLETDKRGGRLLYLHDRPYPNAVDEFFCVVKTELIARPVPSAAPELGPTGWKAVPVDPTPGMIDAADSVNWRNSDTRASVINMWNCMLAAAPEQAEPVTATFGAYTRDNDREGFIPLHSQTCRTCGEGGCPDSVACPKSEQHG